MTTHFARGALVMLCASVACAADWPHWRGPARDGTTTEASGFAPGSAWPAEKPHWSSKLGEGSSSPLVAGGTLFALGWADGKDTLRALGTQDGKELWAQGYKCPRYGRFHVGDEGLYGGPSATPEFDPATKLLYTLSTDGDLNCWDTANAGKRTWGVNLYDEFKTERRPKLTKAPQRDYGYTCAPLVYKNWVLVEVGSVKSGSVVAFDKRTGKRAWASELKDEAGHTGGMALMAIEGVPCVAVVTQRHLAALRLDAGKEGATVAKFEWVTDFANTIAGPAVSGDCALVTSAYNMNALCKVRFTLTEAKEVWRAKFPSKVCTPVIHEGSVYTVWQRVRCLDWNTGERKWEGGAFGDPGSCVVTSDGRVIVYGLNGKLALIEGAERSPKEYKELAMRDKLFRTHAWPHVTPSDGVLYLRDRDGNLIALAVK